MPEFTEVKPDETVYRTKNKIGPRFFFIVQPVAATVGYVAVLNIRKNRVCGSVVVGNSPLARKVDEEVFHELTLAVDFFNPLCHTTCFMLALEGLDIFKLNSLVL